MSLNEEFNIFDPASDVQEAYDQSEQEEFNESKLRPWTIARHSVAIALGCKIVSAVGPFVAEFMETGAYDNVYRDVVIVLYLSSIPDGAVLDLDARINVKTIMTEAYAWAEKHGVVYGSPAFVSGVQILDRILKNILSSFFEVESDGASSEAKKKDTDQPGKSKSQGRPASRRGWAHGKSSSQCLWRKLFNGKHSTIRTSENIRSS